MERQHAVLWKLIFYFFLVALQLKIINLAFLIPFSEFPDLYYFLQIFDKKWKSCTSFSYSDICHSFGPKLK